MVLIAGAGVYFYRTLHQLNQFESQIAALELRIEQAGPRSKNHDNESLKREALLKEVELRKKRFYRPDEVDPYQFSRVIDGLLSSNNLTIDKYQTIDTAETLLLEYTIHGDALGLSYFLEDVSSSEKYLLIPFLSIDASDADGSIRAVFRIRYETIDKSDM
jgi:hypothetical protein